MPPVETENVLVHEKVEIQTLDDYGTAENVVAHKERHRHSAVVGTRFFTQKNFPNTDKKELGKMSNRWSKVKHIYTEIKRLQEENMDKNLSDLDCARMLDKERGSMTLNVFVNHVLTKKHQTKQRKPKSSRKGVANV